MILRRHSINVVYTRIEKFGSRLPLTAPRPRPRLRLHCPVLTECLDQPARLLAVHMTTSARMTATATTESTKLLSSCVHFRPATMSDVEPLIDCYLDNEPDQSSQRQLLLHYWQQWVQQSIEAPLYHVVVIAAVRVQEMEQVVGFQSFLPFTPYLRMRLLTAMSSIYVRRAFHHRGVGSQLMQFSMEYIRSHTGLVRLYAHNDAANYRSVALVRQQGWVVIGQTTINDTDVELIWEYVVVSHARL